MPSQIVEVPYDPTNDWEWMDRSQFEPTEGSEVLVRTQNGTHHVAVYRFNWNKTTKLFMPNERLGVYFDVKDWCYIGTK